MKNLIIFFSLILFTVFLKKTVAQDTIILNKNHLVTIDKKNIPESIEKMDKKVIVPPKKLKDFQKKIFSGSHQNLTTSRYFKTGEIAWKGGLILKNEGEEEVSVEIIFLRNKKDIITSIIFLYLNQNNELSLKDRYYLSIEVDQDGKFVYCFNCLKNKNFEREYLKIPEKIIELVLSD